MWSARLTQLRHLGHTGNDSLDCFREDIKELGFQYGMNDLAAVIGLAQLKNFECQQARRSEIVQRYQAGLEDVSYIELQTEKPYAKNGWPLFAVRVKSWKMAALHGHLTSRGIFTEVIYPNHLYDLYRPYYKRLPVAEAIWREILCLPTYPLLTDTEVDRIIDTIKQFGK